MAPCVEERSHDENMPNPPICAGRPRARSGGRDGRYSAYTHVLRARCTRGAETTVVRRPGRSASSASWSESDSGSESSSLSPPSAEDASKRERFGEAATPGRRAAARMAAITERPRGARREAAHMWRRAPRIEPRGMQHAAMGASRRMDSIASATRLRTPDKERGSSRMAGTGPGMGRATRRRCDCLGRSAAAPPPSKIGPPRGCH